jgi:hypothetical protein
MLLITGPASDDGPVYQREHISLGPLPRADQIPADPP